MNKSVKRIENNIGPPEGEQKKEELEMELPKLNETQANIVKLMCEGLSEELIAVKVGTTPATVKNYKSLIILPCYYSFFLTPHGKKLL